VAQQTIMKPSERLQLAAEPVWEAILAHPYLKELKAGTLPAETFRFYVQQDWLYLQEFTRTAAIIASRSTDPGIMKELLAWVEPLVSMEYHFHRKHAAELGLDFDNITWEMNEANWAYSRHMLACAHTGSTAEALAALLPCPCVYAHVGRQLVAGPVCPRPMYAEWIEFYGPGRVSERIALIEGIFNRVVKDADPATLARCERNYVISSRYEWWFWDTAYGRQTWPV